MAPRETKQAKLDVIAHERLGVLQEALESQGLPSYVERADILSALVLYTTPQQLAGMVSEYWRYTSQPRTEAAQDRPESGGR